MIFCGIIKGMENGSHTTQEAKVIPLAPYLNKKTMREAGRIVFRRLDTDAGESQPEPLARVYDISSRLPKPTTPEVTIEDTATEEQGNEKEAIAEALADIMKNLKALPKYDDDLGEFLDTINDQLEDCYEELSPDQKKALAIKLTSVLSDECHENISRAVVHHPYFVKILGVALYMQYDPLFQAMKRHPSYKPTDETKTIEETSRKAADILSLTPGKYDFDTGAYTPPEH